MPDRKKLLIDMTPDGDFVEPSNSSLTERIGRWAFVIAVLAGGLAAAALALWFALALIPVAIGAALVAWVAFRFQMWRIRRSFPRDRFP
jgi:hypothetical protein